MLEKATFQIALLAALTLHTACATQDDELSETPEISELAAQQAAPAPGAAGPRCVKKPTQVMIIGDSYINWPTHTFPTDLQAASAQRGWRLEALGGASMNSGGIALQVPDQFELAYAFDPDVHTVVMDGGGNDVLIPDPLIDTFSECKNSRNSANLRQCQRIVESSLSRASKLFERMASVGVRDVVYFYYPHVPNGTLLGGANPNVIADYALPKWRDLCNTTEQRTGGKLRCHFVDMVPVFEGHSNWFFPFDIHPNSQGSRAMAKAVWDKMKSTCVGQPESSGCCTP